jgi:NDP-sugar pyrophosphorylase family protein
MEVICLAAGKGTRMGNLGRYLQKCMYPVGLRPFLELSIDNLIASGIDPARDRLTLVVGHLAEQVRDYFGTEHRGLEIGYLEKREQLGTAHALHLVQERLQPSDPVVVWLADLYVPPPLFAAIRTHPERNVLTLGPGHERERRDVRVATDGELVTSTFRSEGTLSDIGLWKLAPDTLQRMLDRREGEYRLLASLQHAIDRGARVGWIEADRWIHLGGTAPTPEANVRAVVAELLALEGSA